MVAGVKRSASSSVIEGKSIRSSHHCSVCNARIKELYLQVIGCRCDKAPFCKKHRDIVAHNCPKDRQASEVAHKKIKFSSDFTRVF